MIDLKHTVSKSLNIEIEKSKVRQKESLSSLRVSVQQNNYENSKKEGLILPPSPRSDPVLKKPKPSEIVKVVNMLLK